MEVLDPDLNKLIFLLFRLLQLGFKALNLRLVVVPDLVALSLKLFVQLLDRVVFFLQELLYERLLGFELI